jgi:hypothetical protein
MENTMISVNGKGEIKRGIQSVLCGMIKAKMDGDKFYSVFGADPAWIKNIEKEIGYAGATEQECESALAQA